VATDDVTGNRKWSRVYDPTFVSYEYSSRANLEPVLWTSFTNGTANASSYLAPAGVHIRLQDASEGFCINPSNYLNNGDGTATCGGVGSPPPPSCGAGKKCCDVAANGSCAQCISNTAQCP
jgi:hypothetical protein